MKNILIIGSINMDMVINTPKIPKLGETITGFGFATIPGGKGANQAVAAARLSGSAKMIGCVGDDINGQALLTNLKSNNVDVTGIKKVSSTSGVAVITICDGDNHIILDKGANAYVTKEVLDENIDIIKWADFVIFQLEIPQETVLYGAKLAKEYNAQVIFNPAPITDFNPEILKYVDIFVPNQHEAGQMLNKNIESIDDAKAAVLEFKKMGISQTVITVGKDGSVFNDGDDVFHQPSFPVIAVDTTAAGDCFIAGFCAGISENMNFREAIRFATAASAITVSRKGASISLPTKSEVFDFLIGK